jgi:hypothetical protein
MVPVAGNRMQCAAPSAQHFPMSDTALALPRKALSTGAPS